MVGHRRGQPLELADGRGPGGNRLAVAVVVGRGPRGGEAHGPLGQGPVQGLLHAGQLPLGGLVAHGVLAHHRAPQGGVPDQEARVDPDVAVQPGQPLAERPPPPVQPGLEGGQGHALHPGHHAGQVVGVLGPAGASENPQFPPKTVVTPWRGDGTGAGIPEQLGVVVGVQVDEAGRHDAPVGVDDPGGALGDGPDGGQAAVRGCRRRPVVPVPRCRRPPHHRG